jgi:hydroxyethylthiazole kinase-like uncharacterized protein yjeF
MAVPQGSIYLTEEIRRIEKAAGDVSPPLMERAGKAAAGFAATLVQEDKKDILVLAGPGNNGGDARIAAERLKDMFFRVSVVSHPRELPLDKSWGLVIDGLFGIGLAREITGDYAQLVDYANLQRCPVLALDGPDHCGEVRVASLDVDFSSVKPNAWVADRALFQSALKPRPRNFHKGNAGSLGIVGGARGMTGAALLAGRAALKMGAGRTYVGLLEHLAVDAGAPELMLRHVDDVLGQDLEAVIAGPGLGRTEHAATLVGAVLASDWPCVLDADALNLIAEDKNLRNACERRRADTLITPHPAEAGRLLRISTSEVQADRLAAARSLAERYNAHALLKGNGSVVVARDGHLFINTSGNPGMASAGMGDVLSGILGALLAQRLSGESALVLGVHLHGAAADELASTGAGPVGLTAGELSDAARRIWNRWLVTEKLL